MSSGIQAFEESRFVDAAHELRREHSLTLQFADRTRWALYLGLSELSLGNLSRAIPRLCEARRAVLEVPTVLTASELGQLQSAWLALGRMPSEPLTRVGSCGGR
jgi:hypothetical protein